MNIDVGPEADMTRMQCDSEPTMNEISTSSIELKKRFLKLENA